MVEYTIDIYHRKVVKLKPKDSKGNPDLPDKPVVWSLVSGPGRVDQEPDGLTARLYTPDTQDPDPAKNDSVFAYQFPDGGPLGNIVLHVGHPEITSVDVEDAGTEEK